MDEQLGRTLIAGNRVVQETSGYTGEIYKTFDWGVQVWNPDRGMERENWAWNMITIRTPRLIKRYPRPWRFPREEATPQCHCKVGRMETEAPNTIRCTKCKFLVGSEAFPNRIERATKFLRKAYPEVQPEVKSSPNLERPTQRKDTRPRRKKRAKVKPRVGVRPSRGRKEKPGHGKSRGSKAKNRRALPTHPKIPKAQKRGPSKISKSKVK